MKHPLVVPALSFGAGIVLARLVAFSPGELCAASAFFAAVALLGLRLARPWMLHAGVAFCALSLGALDALWSPPPTTPAPLPAPDPSGLYSGCVAEAPLTYSGRRQFTLELSPHRRLRVSTHDLATPLPVGTPLAVAGSPRPIRSYRNPGVFDREAYLARRGIFWSLSTPKSTQLQILSGSCGAPAANALARLRAAALSRLHALYPADPYHSALLRALLFGDKDGLRKVWIEDYRRTGTYHAIVISGSHIALVCWGFFLFRRHSGLFARTLLVAAAATGWLYALLAGADPPVLRAAAALSVLALGGLLYRRARALNTLAAVALAFLIPDPDQLFDASFQLSFLAVAALAAFAPTHDPLLEAQARLERSLLAETLQLVHLLPPRILLRLLAPPAAFLWETFRASAVIQFALLLPMALLFHRLSLTGLTANLVVVPALTAALPAGFLALFTNSPLLARLAAYSLDLSRAAAAWHAAREPLYRIPDPPLWLSALLVAALLLLALRRLRPFALALFLAALALLILHPFSPKTRPGLLELTALDVGQGESLLLVSPDGQSALVDTGGLTTFNRSAPPEEYAFDIGEDVVSPYLWRRGFARLDVLVLTHLHDDHAAGAPALLRNFRPRELWLSSAPDHPLFHSISQAAAQSGTRLRLLRAGDQTRLGALRIDVLAPLPTRTFARPHNDDSLVLRVHHGPQSLLLTGDASRAVERALLPLPPVQLLKIAHHGSATANSPEWLDALKPTLALLSAGENNLYHLPSPRTLQALADRHILTRRTDRDGLVTITGDGRYFYPDP